jgi:putative membrane protein
VTASSPLTPEEHRRIHGAVEAIEQSTAADLDIVVTRVSDRYSLYPVVWAAFAAMVVTVFAVLMRPAMSAGAALLFQFLVLTALMLVFDWLPIRLKLVPERVKRAHARQLAHREFAAQYARGGVQPSRILLFVSLGEHHVEIIADHATYSSVPASVWEKAVSDFVAAVTAGRVCDGLLAAIETCGAVLRTCHPAANADRR